MTPCEQQAATIGDRCGGDGEIEIRFFRRKVGEGTTNHQLCCTKYQSDMYVYGTAKVYVSNLAKRVPGRNNSCVLLRCSRCHLLLPHRCTTLSHS